MNTFFSLIQYCPNTARDDVFTIGLVFCAGEYYRCEFSASRVERICRVFDVRERMLLDVTLSSVQHQKFGEAHLRYLSAYENGIIRYTAPKPVATGTPETTFRQLYQAYVDDKTGAGKHEKTQQIGVQFQKALKKDSVLQARLDIRYNLNDILKEYMPDAAIIDYIGGNGTVFCGQMPSLRSDALPRLLLIYESLKQRFEADKLFAPENYHILVNTQRYGGKEFQEQRKALGRWKRLKGFTTLEVENMGEAVRFLRAEVEAKKVKPFAVWYAARQV